MCDSGEWYGEIYYNVGWVEKIIGLFVEYIIRLEVIGVFV